MMSTFVPTTSSPSFKDTWLIVPSVSTGGVSQLVVDLAISTLKLKRVGYLNESSVLPVACVDPCSTGEPGVATALERKYSHRPS
jgi:predicted ATP-grasp superfamily ATP-dependent carboligase